MLTLLIDRPFEIHYPIITGCRHGHLEEYGFWVDIEPCKANASNIYFKVKQLFVPDHIEYAGTIVRVIQNQSDQNNVWTISLLEGRVEIRKDKIYCVIHKLWNQCLLDKREVITKERRLYI